MQAHAQRSRPHAERTESCQYMHAVLYLSASVSLTLCVSPVLLTIHQLEEANSLLESKLTSAPASREDVFEQVCGYLCVCFMCPRVLTQSTQAAQALEKSFPAERMERMEKLVAHTVP